MLKCITLGKYEAFNENYVHMLFNKIFKTFWGIVEPSHTLFITIGIVSYNTLNSNLLYSQHDLIIYLNSMTYCPPNFIAFIFA